MFLSGSLCCACTAALHTHRFTPAYGGHAAALGHPERRRRVETVYSPYSDTSAAGSITYK